MKYVLIIMILLSWSVQTSGQIQNVAILDGVDDGILIDSDGVIANLQAFSIEAQFKISQYSTAPILTRKSTNHQGTFTLGVRDSLIQFIFNSDSNNPITVEAPMVLTTEHWYHVAATYDGAVVSIYIEAQLVIQQAVNHQVATSINGYTLLGINREDGLNVTQAFNGCLDEIRIWNSVRTQRQILRNITYEIDPADPDMLLYYTMSASSGDTVEDQSDEGNNGLKVGDNGPQNGPVILNPFSTVAQIPDSYDICAEDYIEIDLIEHVEYEVSPLGLFSRVGNRLISMPIERDTLIQIVSNNPCCVTNDTLLIPISLSAIETVSEVDIGCAASSIEREGQRYFVGDIITSRHMSVTGCDSISVGLVQSSVFTVDISSDPACDNRNGVLNFDWSTDETINQMIINNNPMSTISNRITDLTSGSYHVELINIDGCSYTETVHIDNTSNGATLSYYVPNAISLSSTSGNDCFSPSFNDIRLLLEYNMVIYDRWGNQVYQSISPFDCWDGSINGQPVASGVYIWQLSVMINSCDDSMPLVENGEMLVLK